MNTNVQWACCPIDHIPAILQPNFHFVSGLRIEVVSPSPCIESHPCPEKQRSEQICTKKSLLGYNQVKPDLRALPDPMHSGS